jgi:hypothetical protein
MRGSEVCSSRPATEGRKTPGGVRSGGRVQPLTAWSLARSPKDSARKPATVYRWPIGPTVYCSSSVPANVPSGPPRQRDVQLGTPARAAAERAPRRAARSGSGSPGTDDTGWAVRGLGVDWASRRIFVSRIAPIRCARIEVGRHTASRTNSPAAPMRHRRRAQLAAAFG